MSAPGPGCQRPEEQVPDGAGGPRQLLERAGPLPARPAHHPAPVHPLWPVQPHRSTRQPRTVPPRACASIDRRTTKCDTVISAVRRLDLSLGGGREVVELAKQLLSMPAAHQQVAGAGPLNNHTTSRIKRVIGTMRQQQVAGRALIRPLCFIRARTRGTQESLCAQQQVSAQD